MCAYWIIISVLTTAGLFALGIISLHDWKSLRRLAELERRADKLMDHYGLPH